jgi:hypothetical protein
MTGDWGQCKDRAYVDCWEERVVIHLRVSSQISAVTRSRAKLISIADSMPETLAEDGTFMAYNTVSTRPKKDVAYGLMQIIGSEPTRCELPRGESIRDSYGNMINGGQSYVVGHMFVPFGDGLCKDTALHVLVGQPDTQIDGRTDGRTLY